MDASEVDKAAEAAGSDEVESLRRAVEIEQQRNLRLLADFDLFSARRGGAYRRPSRDEYGIEGAWLPTRYWSEFPVSSTRSSTRTHERRATMTHTAKEGTRPCASALWVAALAVAAVALPVSAGDALVTFQAFAVNVSNVGQQGAQPLDITIERWTTDEEFAKLRDALVEKGPDGLMSALQKIKPRAGYIRAATGGLGWDLQFARKVPLPSGGYRVIFATDRPMSFYERATQPRSAEYEFLAGEMRIGPDGKGEGKLVPMAKITYNKVARLIEIENYANEPVRLNEIRESKRKGD